MVPALSFPTELLLRDLGIDEEPEALIARLHRNFGVEA